jgi:ankyrin repeat protein
MLENDYGNDSIIFIDEEPKPDIEKVNSIIKQVLELARSYKINNFENIQKSIIKIINNSEINPSNIKNKNGETLTHLIIKEGDLESLKLIIESYIQLLGFTSLFFDWFLSEDNDGQTILEICVKYSNNKDIIKYIYEIVSKTTDSNFRLKENRKGIFHYAAIYNKIYPIIYFYEKLQRFFKNTLIIDVPTKDGMTPLLYACRNGNKEISNLLIDLGANINWKDNKGNTCLHYAVSSGNDSLVKKLIMFGADKKSKNEKEETPLDIALKSNNNKIIGILKDKKCPIIMSLFNVENREIKSLKNNGNNFFILFIILLFIALYKWNFLLKIYFVYQHNNKYDIIPFVYDMNSIRIICQNVFPGKEYKDCEINNKAIQLYIQNTNHTKSQKTNIKELFKEDVIGYNYLESFYIFQWIFTLLEVIILFILIKFLFSSKHIYIKQNEIRKSMIILNYTKKKKIFVLNVE